MDSPFYRTELNGERVGVEFAEIHALRKDILLYFDDNLEENISVLMPEGQYQLAYWQYLSVSFEQEWAESVRYQKLVEEGCLALLNGIAMELLDQPITCLHQEWPALVCPRCWRTCTSIDPPRCGWRPPKPTWCEPTYLSSPSLRRK